uniref:C1q domain-containing protein n=1 Tax=Takifugu rubripes TaxID=31033 RepID=A0A3B5K7Y9_TAKRU
MMELRALLFFTFLGFLFLKPGFGNIHELLKAQERSRKSLEDKVDHIGACHKDVEALKERLNVTVDEVDRLKKDNKDLPKIAFSASLSNSGEIYQGPSTNKTLIYKRVFSNTGGGYDQHTGIFTAPVSGLYYFSFSTYGYNTHVTGAILVKNGILQISTYDFPSNDGSDSSSNSVVLQLHAGDAVHMELWTDGRVFDNQNAHTTFSGFLIFPQQLK